MSSTAGRAGFDAAAIRDHCVSFVAQLLNEKKEAIDADAEFDRLGLDSAMAVAMIFDLEESLGIELSPSLLFDHTTIAKLAGHLAGETAAHAGVSPKRVAVA
jgi:acyl carrier protein